MKVQCVRPTAKVIKNQYISVYFLINFSNELDMSVVVKFH